MDGLSSGRDKIPFRTPIVWRHGIFARSDRVLVGRAVLMAASPHPRCGWGHEQFSLHRVCGVECL